MAIQHDLARSELTHLQIDPEGAAALASQRQREAAKKASANRDKMRKQLFSTDVKEDQRIVKRVVKDLMDTVLRHPCAAKVVAKRLSELRGIHDTHPEFGPARRAALQEFEQAASTLVQGYATLPSSKRDAVALRGAASASSGDVRRLFDAAAQGSGSYKRIDVGASAGLLIG
ncbi:MAG TPA: hypothetical protein VFH51_20630, partial [Myxococcota bacterium]|nr:hypothetical protein [Myxococcota bacterium]